MSLAKGIVAGLLVSGIMLGSNLYWYGKAKEAKAAEIRGAFEFGVKVGEVVGGCRTLKDVSDHNPTSDWARSAPVRTALASCANLPETPEIVVRGEDAFVAEKARKRGERQVRPGVAVDYE